MLAKEHSAEFSIAQGATTESALRQAKAALAKQSELTFCEPALEARILFEYVSGKSHSWQISHATDELSEELANAFSLAIDSRLKGTPIAYITGTQAFWSLVLEVQPCTLIPRQDTETLVEAALELPVAEKARALDLGTGTGAIALALAKERPNWQIIGLDFVLEAVELAKRNAQRNAIEASFLQSDWFSAIKSQQKFDLIVSNPPYVEEDSEYLNQGDLRFEPKTALTAQENGLADIRHIIERAPLYLRPNGYLVLEHGMSQAADIAKLLKQTGFVQIQSKRDYNDLPRVTLAKHLGI